MKIRKIKKIHVIKAELPPHAVTTQKNNSLYIKELFQLEQRVRDSNHSLIYLFIKYLYLLKNFR